MPLMQAVAINLFTPRATCHGEVHRRLPWTALVVVTVGLGPLLPYPGRLLSRPSGQRRFRCADRVLLIGSSALRKGSQVTKLTLDAATAGLVLAAAGCVSPQQQAAQKEDLLAACCCGLTQPAAARTR